MALNIFSKNKKAGKTEQSPEQHPNDLESGLQKTKENVFKKLSRAVVGKSRVDDDVLDQLEEILISSDVGVDTTLRIIERIEKRVSKDKYLGTDELNNILKEEITQMLAENEYENDVNFFSSSLPGKPYVILVLGVNGVGKTTTIAKLANKFKQNGKDVYLAAADTFRAAAIDQLEKWSSRIDVKLIKQSMGSDPASVAYDAVKSAQSNDIDVVIIDTAGRLHNKQNLMNELAKIKRAIQKIDESTPHEILLILDASTGQNAFEQARQFTNVTQVNAMALTKLDGTAKGGVVLGISDQLKVPVKYIGIGEGIDDLRIFNRKEFVESLFNQD